MESTREHVCDGNAMLQVNFDERAAQASLLAGIPGLSDVVDKVRQVAEDGADAAGSALAEVVAQVIKPIGKALEALRAKIEELRGYTARSKEAILGNLTVAEAATAEVAELAAWYESSVEEAVGGFHLYWEPVEVGFAGLASLLVKGVKAVGQADMAEQLNATLTSGLVRLEAVEQAINRTGHAVKGLGRRAEASLQAAIRRVTRQVNSSLEEGLTQLDMFINATLQGLDNATDGILQAIDGVVHGDDKASIEDSLDNVTGETQEVLEENRRAVLVLAQGLGGGAAVLAERSGVEAPQRSGAGALLRPGALLLVPMLLRWL